ncbi:MAG: hypothetical protein AAF561_11730 [Planctomycetota bacterium]
MPARRWKPVRIKPKPAEPAEPMWRRLVSRIAMALLGVAMLYGGYRTARVAIDIRQETYERVEGRNLSVRQERRQRKTGTEIFWLATAALIIPGAGLVLFSVVPISVMEQFMSSEE